MVPADCTAIMIEFLPHTSLMAAFMAGLLSFVSPCVLPLVPSYLICITGFSLEQLIDSAERNRSRKAIVTNALLFIAGFSLVFTAFGASASLIGQFLTNQQHLIRKIGGILIVLFGLYLLGIVKPKFLMSEKRICFRSRPAGYLGSLLIGATFAAGWTPCVGPVLGTMLLYAARLTPLQTGSHYWLSIPLAWDCRYSRRRWGWTTSSPISSRSGRMWEWFLQSAGFFSWSSVWLSTTTLSPL
jgi:cytochrome c-type biogenesis protein